jgi:hypothetical protein
LVFGGLLSVLDLADLLALGGVGDVLGLLLADRAVGTHRRVAVCDCPPEPRRQNQRSEETGKTIERGHSLIYNTQW